MRKVTLAEQEKGIVSIVLNDTENELNILSEAFLGDLEKAVDEAKERNPNLMIIESAKEGCFAAGVDIKEIESLKEDKLIAEKVGKAHAIFAKIEDLPFPTVALIEGVCLGGGLELAMSCDYRIAVDCHKTVIALPEVQFGIIPGFGGTYRLPLLFPLEEALLHITTGKKIKIDKAMRLHLIDSVISEEEFLSPQKLLAVKNVLSKPKRKKQFRPSFYFLIPFVKSFFFKQARERVIKETRGQYPAPLAAVDVIKATYGKSRNEAIRTEQKYLTKLIKSDVCKNLIHVFFATQDVKKHHKEAPIHRLVKKVGVVGGGAMGSDIAWISSANAGAKTFIKEVSADKVEAVKKHMAETAKTLVEKKILTHDKTDAVLSALSYGEKYDEMEDADLVIEAVVENMDVKKKLFKELEGQLPERAILCSNTSSLSIEEMSSELKRPENFLGMHFFNPANRMPLVEIIASSKTSKETLESAVHFTRKLGKTPIVVKDSPGFVVNRILLPYINEAAHLLTDGFNVHEIDREIMRFGMPMGPLRLLDKVGIDVGMKIADVLKKVDHWAEPVVYEFLREKHLLGEKNQLGVYDYKKKIAVYISCCGSKIHSTEPIVNPALKEYLSKNVQKRPDATVEDIMKRCIYIMINTAYKCLDEKIVESEDEIDLAMILGTGFPPFRGGLLRYARQVGLLNVKKSLLEYQKQLGDRFKPAAFFDKL